MIEISFLPVEMTIKLVAGNSIDMLVPLTTTQGADADLTGYVPTAWVVDSSTGSRLAMTAGVEGSAVRLSMTPAQTAQLSETNRWELNLAAGETFAKTPVGGVLLARRPL